MTSYKNLAGNMGICSYELGDKKIRIKFHSRKSFLFDHKSTGEEHVDKMKHLATQGFGLYNYIEENITEDDAIALD